MKSLVLFILINHADGTQDVALRYELPAAQCLSMQAVIWGSNGPVVYWAGEPSPASVIDATCAPAGEGE